MNYRERFFRTFHFQPVDHVPDVEFGYWWETAGVWRAQGLPEDVTNLDDFFGFEPRGGAPFHTDMPPGFDYQQLDEDDLHITIRDSDGAIKMINKDGTSSIPKHIKFALETRADWETEFKWRLDPTNPARCTGNFDEWKASVQDRDYPLGIGSGAFLVGFGIGWGSRTSATPSRMIRSSFRTLWITSPI